MKRLLLMAITLALLGTGAFAAEWPAGCSPENPYADAQGNPVDFEKTTGYLMLNPMQSSTVAYGISSVTVYMPREDLEKSEGKLYVHNKAGEFIAEIELNDSNYLQRPMTEEELNSLRWGCGTAFTVVLGTPLPAETDYVVQLTEGAISAPAFGNASPGLTNENGWHFTTEAIGSYYLDSMYLYRGEQTADAEEEPEETEAEPEEEDMNVLTEEEAEALAAEAEEEPEEVPAEAAPVELTVPEDALPYGAALETGDTVHFVIRMGDAAAASVYVDDGELEMDESFFEQESAVTLTLTQPGLVTWGVVWMDAEGNALDSIDFTYNVM